MTDAQTTVHLADYQPFTHRIDGVELTFRLDPMATRVVARIAFRPNPDRPGRHPLRLDGEGLKLIGPEEAQQIMEKHDGPVEDHFTVEEG